VTRLTISLQEPLARRFYAAARFTGFKPEDLATIALCRIVDVIREDNGLVLGAETDRRPAPLPVAPDAEL
jgi:hypothetical protein